MISKEMKRVNHLIGEIDRVYHEIALKLELSDSVMMILYTICDSGVRCPLQDICKRSGLSKQTINSALRKMEAEGLIFLTSSSGKNKDVCLTEEGICLMNRTAGRVLQMENDIMAAWPKEDVEKYLELTKRFLLDLQQKAKEL